MLKPALFILLLLPTLPVHALDPRHTAPERLLKLGEQLAASAGASQWQQMWQRTRAAGHFQAQATLAHFVIEQAQLPKLAQLTLARADQVQALSDSVARYRRHFPDQPIGFRGEQVLYALCLEVDWRTLPVAMAERPHAYLPSARLLGSYPCR